MVIILVDAKSNNSCAVENGGCDQLCNVTGNNVSYCSCFEGYTLSSDSRSCNGKDDVIADDVIANYVVMG